MRRVLLRSSVVLLVGAAVLSGILYLASTVDSRPPVVGRVGLTQHLAGDAGIALTTTSIEVAYSETVDHASAETAISIAPKVPGSFSWSGTTVTFTPADPLPLQSSFVVTIGPGARDEAGNTMQAAADPFSFTTVGSPSVAATDPGDGDAAVARDAELTITFSTLMDTASVEDALRLTPRTSAALRWSGERLTIVPEQPLEAGRRYRIEIDTTATDLAGTPLDAALRISFVTARTDLEVVQLLPADGVEGIAGTTVIGVVFDRPLDPDSVDAALLTVDPAVPGSLEAVPLPGAAALGAGGARLLRFMPSSTLPANTTFEVTLAAGVSADGGGGLAAPLTWTFTTGAPSTTLSNQIVFLSPRGGVANVWAMNPDGTNQRQVTAELSAVTDFAVAPDGRSLVLGDGVQLVEQLVDGRDRRVLTDAANLEFDPAYSPDGRTIAFGRADAATGGGLGIWLRGVAGADATRLVPPRELTGETGSPSPSVAGSGEPLPSPLLREPAFSPDGGALAYVDTAGRVAVVELPADRLTTAEIDAAGPISWLPDSTGILVDGVVLDGPRADAELPRHEPGTPAEPLDPASADLADQDVLRLFRGSRDPAPTPFDAPARVAVDDRGRIAYVTLPRGDDAGSIWITTAGGGARGRLLGDGALVASWVAFTPETGKLLVARASGDGVPTGIWLIDLDSGSGLRLTEGGTRPRWLP